MTPEDRLRALRSDERWESTTLTPRSTRLATADRASRHRTVVPVLITAIVAVLVIIVSIGAIRLGGTRSDHRPAATPTATANGATAIIRGTASTTTRTIAGAGRPGGPDAAEIRQLQTLAKRVGAMSGQPDTSRSSNARLTSAVVSVQYTFGAAVHDLGGTGPHVSVFFIVLHRAPTGQELQLLRLLPYTVRLSWGPRISVKERLRQQDAAFSAVAHEVLDASGTTQPETDTQTLSFWPDRDDPKSAEQIAQQMADTITRLSGAPPTFSIEVTDESKTPDGQAALHAIGHPLSDTGVRLLIGARPTETGMGVGTGGRYGLNPQRCVALGDAVIIAPPGSSISADGRTIHARGLGTYRISTDTAPEVDTFPERHEFNAGGGGYIDAKTAAGYLPRGSTLCGATRFLLIGR